MPKQRVIVAMSGGVDSSIAAILLKEAGYEVIGITMHLWCEVQSRKIAYRSCCSQEDIRDAEIVCHKLGIPFYVLNFEPEFQKHVIDYFCEEYSKGRTPNPCLACNQHIKFNLLLNRALALDADYLATGHYARIKPATNGYHLLKASDPLQDQTYFLYMLEQKELKHLLFPLGQYSKVEVRQLARERRLPVSEKPKSQEICFIPDGDYRTFLASRLTLSQGEIVDAGGKLLGRHQGIAYYTIGQRRGLGLNPGKRLYVTRIDPSSNRVIVGSEEALLHRELVASTLSWVLEKPATEPIVVTAKIRYKSPESIAILSLNGEKAVVKFQQPQKAITPGQAVVFYRGDELLGGGIIESTSNNTNLE